MTQTNEVIFSAPPKILADLVKALRYLKEHEWGFPWKFELKPERELSESYIKLGEMMGMKYR